MAEKEDDGHLHPVVGTDGVDVLCARDGLLTRRDVSKGKGGKEGKKRRTSQLSPSGAIFIGIVHPGTHD
jgi:hypothetical protein